MSQPLTVAYRGGQLVYPIWTAHTTCWRELLVDGASRCKCPRQAGQGFSGLTLNIQHVSIRTPVAHPLDEERIDSQVICKCGPSPSETSTVTGPRLSRILDTVERYQHCCPHDNHCRVFPVDGFVSTSMGVQTIPQSTAHQ